MLAQGMKVSTSITGETPVTLLVVAPFVISSRVNVRFDPSDACSARRIQPILGRHFINEKFNNIILFINVR